MAWIDVIWARDGERVFVAVQQHMTAAQLGDPAEAAEQQAESDQAFGDGVKSDPGAQKIAHGIAGVERRGAQLREGKDHDRHAAPMTFLRWVLT
mgnify:CR=1 FL=1